MHLYQSFGSKLISLCLILAAIVGPMRLNSGTEMPSIETLTTFDAPYVNRTQEQFSLIAACRLGNVDIVYQLLQSGTDINKQINGESTPLITAIKCQHTEIAKLLLSRGAKPNLGSNETSYPIIEAVKTGDQELIELILFKAKSDIKELPGSNEAIKIAVEANAFHLVELMTKHGIEINAQLCAKDRKALKAYYSSK